MHGYTETTYKFCPSRKEEEEEIECVSAFVVPNLYDGSGHSKELENLPTHAKAKDNYLIHPFTSLAKTNKKNVHLEMQYNTLN